MSAGPLAPAQPALLPVRPREPRPARAPRAAWRPSEGLTVFVVSAAVYLVVALEMLHRSIVFPDATSRVANGYFVLFSRDPHLPAVGFVWNPLPSLLLLPLLAFKSVLPVLVRDGFAGNLESVLFMAGSVTLLAGCLRRLQVTRRPRLLLVALFALHPLILTYAGNGESEAVLLFFLLLAVRALLGYLVERRPAQLASTGVALGLAYLSRYEAVAPAVAVTALVAVVSAHRSAGPAAHRARVALNDAVLVAFPFAFAFALWAISSRVLVHAWFPTLTSEYGNAAQVSSETHFITSGTGTTPLAALRYVTQQLTAIAPLAAPLLLAAAVLAARRRDLLAVAAPVALGSVLVFDNLAFLTGSSFGWLRFQITVIPLTVLVAGRLINQVPGKPVGASSLPLRRRNAGAALVGRIFPQRTAPAGTPSAVISSARVPSARTPSAHTTLGLAWSGRAPAAVSTALITTLVLVAVGLGLPVGARTLLVHRIAREETFTMLAALSPNRAIAQDRQHLLIFQTEKQVAADLDAMHLGRGQVLTDSAYAFAVILASDHPQQFVITSDRDFRPAVTDPGRYGVRYLLVPQPGFARSDALLRSRPALFSNGAGIATIVHTWRGTSYLGNWRLLRVTGRR